MCVLLWGVMQAEPDLPRLSPCAPKPEAHQQLRQRRSADPAAECATAAPATAGAAAAAGAAGTATKANGRAAADAAGAQEAGAATPTENGHLPLANGGGKQQSQVPLKAVRLSIADFGDSIRGYRTDGAALLLLAAFTVLLAVGAALERRHSWLRGVWFSCLFGIPG